MTWKGEKQRHSMSARGIKSTLDGFKKTLVPMQDEAELKMSRDVAEMLAIYGLKINPTDIDVFYNHADRTISVNIYSGPDGNLEEFTLESPNRLSSFSEYLEEYHETEYNDAYMQNILGGIHDAFNERVKHLPESKQEEVYMSIEENYGSMEEWLMKTNMKRYNEVEVKAIESVAKEFENTHHFDEYRDYILDRIDSGAQKIIGKDFTVGGYRVSNYSYKPFDIRFDNVEAQNVEAYINRLGRYLQSGGTRV